MAPLLRWRLMTCLKTFIVTWKWPGCLDVLAPPLFQWDSVMIIGTCIMYRVQNMVLV